MKYFLNFIVVLSILFFLLHSCRNIVKSDVFPYDLTCEYTSNPMGIEVVSPRLSWKLNSNQRGQEQTAYRILVATTEELLDQKNGDMWDSGKQETNQSINISYAGLTLESGSKYYWKVMVWDINEIPGLYSNLNWFEMGKLKDYDWKATWISAEEDGTNLTEVKPAPYFRKEFNVNKKIKKARLYISGLGYYESFINGDPTGDDELQPAFTRYDRRVKYLIYDVTDLLTIGDNCIGVILGNGWYNQHTRSAWDLDQATWRNWPTMMLQVEITYQDGTFDNIISDKTWKFSSGPIFFDGIRNGEHYDARRELSGWSKSGYVDHLWAFAHEVKGPEGKLSAQLMPPIRIVEEINPQSISNPSPGIYVMDFGRNIVGRLRISVNGLAGQEIIMKYGERLDDQGMLDQKELARFIRTGETQTDRYTCKGEENEYWESSFVYHGYQYVEISGLTSPPKPGDFTGVVLNTDLKSIGSFSCSNDLVNATHQNTLWSFLGNYHGYPTDCPHREKIGWSGDAHLVAGVGCYNFDIATSYLKWMDDFMDEQRPDGKVPAIIPTSGWGYTYGRDNNPHGYGPHWEGAYVLIPWELYLFTGDIQIIEKYYPGWKTYLEYLKRSTSDYILSYGIDDHKTIESNPPKPAFISTAYYYGITRIMEKTARIMNIIEDEESFKDLGDNIYAAFNNRYFDKENNTYEKGSQAALSGALYFDLVPDESRDIILKKLIQKIEEDDFHIRCGVVGTKWLIGSLMKYDKNELLYKIIDSRDFPGWGYWIDQGATTLLQTWSGDMSLNHIMFGSIDEWFFKSLGGIRYDVNNPGFQQFELNPSFPDGLDWVNCSFNSVYGTISSNWKKTKNQLDWDINVPANAKALIYFPKSFGAEIFVSGESIDNIDYLERIDESDRYSSYLVKSGSYHITIQ